MSLFYCVDLNISATQSQVEKLGYTGEIIPITKENDRKRRHHPDGYESIVNQDGSVSYSEVIKTSQQILDECKINLSSKRWEKTEQGVTIDGVAFQSDKNSKDEMAGYVANGVTEVHWKHSYGNIITYPIAYFTDVYNLVQQYRNDCFGVEKSKQAEMDIAEDPTTFDIETGWPDTTFTTS
jgi:hypothetical protein